ncbi:hypothetical protein, partial [Neptuniibacter sp. UBA6509]|uniref:hypothetical protein n=1 Tax=Neptuniibacter sp. UBA6509 TaxID=1946976 RepID=UPI0025E579B6
PINIITADGSTSQRYATESKKPSKQKTHAKNIAYKQQTSPFNYQNHLDNSKQHTCRPFYFYLLRLKTVKMRALLHDR